MTQIELTMGSGDESVIEEIFSELRKAEAKFPGWPDDVVHGAGIVAEEAGETMQAALGLYYGRGSVEKLRKEAAQTRCDGNSPADVLGPVPLPASHRGRGVTPLEATLLDRVRELRDFSASCMRLLATLGMDERLVLECERMGIEPGIGVRADKAIAEAEARKEGV